MYPNRKSRQPTTMTAIYKKKTPTTFVLGALIKEGGYILSRIA